jgi:hypothetical protein
MSDSIWNKLLVFLSAGGVLATWGVFAWSNKTPVDGFVMALSSTLSGLGVHAVTTYANGKKEIKQNQIPFISSMSSLDQISQHTVPSQENTNVNKS